MGFIIAAALGGFFVGGFVFYLIGAARGYVSAVRHLTAIGAAMMQNAAASQKPQPVAVSKNSSSTQFN